MSDGLHTLIVLSMKEIAMINQIFQFSTECTLTLSAPPIYEIPLVFKQDAVSLKIILQSFQRCFYGNTE